jgi:glycogen synthase
LFSHYNWHKVASRLALPRRFFARSSPEVLVHVLVTTDTLSGVWVYTRELVTGLVNCGARVTLVSFGEIPLPEQTSWMGNLPGLEYHPTAFRLDWMQEGEQDLKDSFAYLVALVREREPDLLHSSQLCYGSLPVPIPRVVVAHRDLISWWSAVHGREPEEGRWLRWYRDIVMSGVSRADAVVAPSAWMLNMVRTCYGQPKRGLVIYNGRNPLFFNPYVSKENSVLAVGDLWDAGRQVSLLTQHTQSLPVCIVGSEMPRRAFKVPIHADVKVAVDSASLALKELQNEAQMRNLYSRAAIYAATARYEPFSLSTLEAALSRCAIVANDIPSLREMWGDAALYFRANDADSLAELLQRLSEDRELCRAYANRAYQLARERFTAKRMVDEYLHLYRRLLGTESLAA